MHPTAPPPLALQVEHLWKAFGPVAALRDVGFEVQAGEIFGYLGPNGAGKSTTLRILMDLVRADRGSFRLAGQPGRAAQARLATGYLPGELRLDGDLTGRAVLDHFARLRPSRPPILRAALAERLGLGPADLGRRVKHLSHGTRQKLGLVVALQHDPDLALLDEPTIGLDPLVQRALLGFLQERAAAGRAVLLSSHVLSEVEAVCGRVGILRAGRLVAVESIDALRRRVVRRIRVRGRGPLPADLERTPGVARVEARGREATLWVQGDFNPILRRLASLDLDEFDFPEPLLEDIFLAYYEGGQNA